MRETTREREATRERRRERGREATSKQVWGRERERVREIRGREGDRVRRDERERGRDGVACVIETTRGERNKERV